LLVEVADQQTYIVVLVVVALGVFKFLNLNIFRLQQLQA
jgi:hypothetical protein